MLCGFPAPQNWAETLGHDIAPCSGNTGGSRWQWPLLPDQNSLRGQCPWCVFIRKSSTGRGRAHRLLPPHTDGCPWVSSLREATAGYHLQSDPQEVTAGAFIQTPPTPGSAPPLVLYDTPGPMGGGPHVTSSLFT